MLVGPPPSLSFFCVSSSFLSFLPSFSLYILFLSEGYLSCFISLPFIPRFSSHSSLFISISTSSLLLSLRILHRPALSSLGISFLVFFPSPFFLLLPIVLFNYLSFLSIYIYIYNTRAVSDLPSVTVPPVFCGGWTSVVSSSFHQTPLAAKTPRRVVISTRSSSISQPN